MAAIESHVGESLLDVGCGNGQYVFHYQDRCRTAGVDIQTYPQWETAPERFQTADACALPFEDGSFDTVVSFETLEHVPDPETALRELHRVSRRNVIVSVPNCDIPQPLKDSRLTYFHYTDRSHVNFYTEQTLAEALTGAGFASVDVRPINPCPVRPLIEGLFGLPSLLTRIAVKLAGRSPFHMTLLAVADRT